MEIEFVQTLYASTGLPDQINFDHAAKEYSPFSASQITSVEHSLADGVTVSKLNVSNARNITLTQVLTLGSLARDQASIGTMNVGDTENVLDIQLGQTEDGLHQLHIVVDVECTAKYDNRTELTYTVLYRYVNIGGLDVESQIFQRANMLYNPSQYILGLQNYGSGFIKLPDREDGLEHDIFVLFTGASQYPQLIQNITLAASNQNTQYNLSPGVQYSQQAPDEIILAVAVDMQALADIDMYFAYNESSPEAGEASEPDGYNPGSSGFDDSSDSIDIPDAPTIGVSNVGFVNVYKTYQNNLQNMGVELFPALTYNPPSPPSTGVSVADAVIELCQNFTAFVGNIPAFFDQINAATYINYIIDCHVLPVTPSGGTSENIKVGNKTLTVTGDRLSSDYVDVDCGTILLAEYYANFADFLTSFKLFLPFVGFVPAKPEWFYRESLNVTYRFNVIDGSFMAFVRSTGAYVNNNNSGKTIVGQYGGNACIHLPITGVTYASMVSGLIGAGAGAVAGAASGNVGAVATSALAAANAHGDIAQSNSYSSSVAFLGCRRPFVLIERPVSNFSKTYSKELGIPSNISRKLGNVSGFSVIGDVHLDGISATDAEKAEIERLLHEGVIL